MHMNYNDTKSVSMSKAKDFAGQELSKVTLSKVNAAQAWKRFASLAAVLCCRGKI